jgi:hypothetical protein
LNSYIEEDYGNEDDEDEEEDNEARFERINKRK